MSSSIYLGSYPIFLLLLSVPSYPRISTMEATFQSHICCRSSLIFYLKIATQFLVDSLRHFRYFPWMFENWVLATGLDNLVFSLLMFHGFWFFVFLIQWEIFLESKPIIIVTIETCRALLRWISGFLFDIFLCFNWLFCFFLCSYFQIWYW